MTNTTHTPGPWTVRTMPSNIGGTPITRVETTRGGRHIDIAHIYDSDDAALIAAAPDMVEALIEAYDYLVASAPRPDARKEVITKAKRALDKALGV